LKKICAEKKFTWNFSLETIFARALQPTRSPRTTEAHRQQTKSPLVSGPSSNSATSRKSGAGEGARTLDPDLGKVVLYH
jgi:hypothetical protein